MDTADFLDRVFWGNTSAQWLWAVGIFLAVILALWPLRRFILNRLNKFAIKTDTAYDNLAIGVLRKTKLVFVFLVATWAGSQVLSMSALLSLVMDKTAIIAAVLQIGIWANAALMGWLQIVRESKAKDGDTLTWLGGLEWTGKFVIWVAVLLAGLENLDVDVTGLVTGLGIGGIAVALAAQNILGDLFSAFSIYIDQPFVIGDYLKIGDQMGTVESIGMKTTRLRSLTGEQLIFGNSDLISSRIQNLGRLNERRASFTVGVTYDTPKEKVERIPGMIQQILEGQEDVRFDRSHFKEFGDSALIVDTVYFVLVPAFARKMEIQEAVNLELMQWFETEGIEFAFPSQTIYLKSDSAAD
jgi:small-conductance mechanosensitive channel